MNNTSNALIERHEAFLSEILQNFETPAQRLAEAVQYSLFPGGKRLRPILVYLCGEILEVNLDCLDSIAAAVEITHCYSLVHDDLPAMDNDDYRRGKLSCHRAFDEATAILVGDGMQALAIDVLLSRLPRCLDATRVLKVVHELVQASGNAGMVSGQSLDLSELQKPHIDEQSLSHIHYLKTGKLISACINMVLAAADISNESAQRLRDYAKIMGLVFQMQDDYLDRYGIDSLGKVRSSDLANNKTTFANLYGKQALLDKIEDYYEQAQNHLMPFGLSAEKLQLFTRKLQLRSHFLDKNENSYEAS